MGNTWKGISDEDLNEAEVNLLTRAGLKTEEYTIHNTPVDEIEVEHYIHCVEVSNTELPKMVLVHGYGAGGGVFFRVIKDLSKHSLMCLFSCLLKFSLIKNEVFLILV